MVAYWYVKSRWVLIYRTPIIIVGRESHKLCIKMWAVETRVSKMWVIEVTHRMFLHAHKLYKSGIFGSKSVGL